MSTTLTTQEVREQLEKPESREAIERAERDGHRAVREQLVYQHGGRSYFADLAFAERGDRGALDRLERHGQQMDEAAKYREVRTLEGTEFEYRVNPNLEVGHGGEFAPPLWVNEMFSSIPRSSECIQRLAPKFDLPPGVSSVNLPRMTAGTQTKIQTPGGKPDSRDVTTTPVVSPASTFAGISDWAIQVLEQSPSGAHLDWVVQKDLMESIDSKVEDVILSGTGTNEQFYGILNLPEANNIPYTGAVEAKALTGGIGETIAATGLKRRKPPEGIFMNTARWAWLNFSPDSEKQQVFTDYVGREFPVASLGGFAVYLYDSIKAELGTTKKEDTIIACRPSDFVIFYSEPKFSVQLDVLSGALGARFLIHRYVAAILGRYPSGVSFMSGVGMEPATGYH